MSHADWWASQPPAFKFLTTDKFGMTAIHTTRPTYLAAAGKWFPSGNGRRADLVLRDIGHDFSPTSSLSIRPGCELEGTEPTVLAERVEPTAPPQHVNEVTPSEHLVSIPRGDSLVEIKGTMTTSHPPGTPFTVVTVPTPDPSASVHALSPLQTVQIDPIASAVMSIGAVLDAMIKVHTNSDGGMLRPLEAVRPTLVEMRKQLEILANARKAGLL